MIIEKWLEFRVSEACEHEQDIYHDCPLCEIKSLTAKLEAATTALERLSSDAPMVENRASHICFDAWELKTRIDFAAAALKSIKEVKT